MSRKEFQDWERNIIWGRDGTLYLTTFPDICIAQPIYRKDIDGNSKHLFHVQEYSLKYDNKFEFESADQNSLLNSQPVSFARVCKPSPVDSLLAVLTSNLNVMIFKDRKLLMNLDEDAKDLERRAYHSVEWSPDGNFIAIGNEKNELVIFSIERNSDGKIHYKHKSSIELGESLSCGWVTHICWDGDTIIACLNDSSVYLIGWEEPSYRKQLKAASRFKIVDVCVMGKCVLITDSCHFHSFDLSSSESSNLILGPGDEFFIIPLQGAQNEVVLISNKTSCKVKLQQDLSLLPDDIVSPHLERKFKRWSAVSNEFSKYETTLLLHGISLSPDGYSVALVYSMERISMKYRIASEHQYKVIFIPLYDSWKISRRATGLAWYQTYQIYKSTLPLMDEEVRDKSPDQTSYHVNMELKDYLKAFLNDKEMNNLRFFNFVEENPSIQLFRKTIFEYAVAKRSAITNPLDKASVQSLASVLRCSSPVESKIVEIKSEFLNETFDFKKNTDADVIHSEQNHTWRRCAVTLLPVLTTKVKICPISNQRIIDIKRDTVNEYGWFTRTLLEVLNGESIYTGTTMATA